jgi:hypothetical protein
VHTLRTQDFGELADALPRWDLRCRQFGRGAFQGQLQFLRLGAMEVFRLAANRRPHFVGWPLPDSFSAALAKKDAGAPVRVIPVWPDRAPGSEGWTQKEVEYRNDWDHKRMARNVTTPTLTAFIPDNAVATGAAVVIRPGGGFRFLSWQSEGTEVAAGPPRPAAAPPRSPATQKTH